MRSIVRALREDRGRISIPVNAGLMVALSILLLVLPGVTVIAAAILLLIAIGLISVFVAIVFDTGIAVGGSRLALAALLVLLCLIVSFAGIYHAQSDASPRAFNAQLGRLGALRFSIGVVSTAGMNGVTARSSAAQNELALQELVDITALALLFGGLVRRLGGGDPPDRPTERSRGTPAGQRRSARGAGERPAEPSIGTPSRAPPA